MSAPAPLGKNRAAARVCNCITLIHWGRAEGAGRTLICWVLLVDDCVWLWLPRYGVGHGADAEIPILQGGAEMSHRAQNSSSQGEACRAWAGPEEQSKCLWAKLGPALNPKKSFIVLSSFCVSVIFIFPTSDSTTGIRTKNQLHVSCVWSVLCLLWPPLILGTICHFCSQEF